MTKEQQDWILLGVDRKGEAFVMDADSGFFDVDLLTEFWAYDNGIDYPPLACGMYLMTDVVITPDSFGDPTFKGTIEPLATIAQVIEARRVRLAREVGEAVESAVMVCRGCGSAKTRVELRAGGWINCCPERAMNEVIQARYGKPALVPAEDCHATPPRTDGEDG